MSLKEKVLENLLEFENDGSTGTGVERQLTVCWGAEGISIEERKRVVPSLVSSSLKLFERDSELMIFAID